MQPSTQVLVVVVGTYGCFAEVDTWLVAESKPTQIVVPRTTSATTSPNMLAPVRPLSLAHLVYVDGPVAVRRAHGDVVVAGGSVHHRRVRAAAVWGHLREV